MHSPAVDWALFMTSALFTVGAGIAIGRISGELGERLGLGRAWAGAVLVSLATTLPELVTTITVALRGSYGLAMGGIIGSITLNLFILVLVDVVDPDPLYNRLSKNHLATGLLGAALLAMFMTALSLGMAQSHELTGVSPSWLWTAPAAMIGFYGIGQFVLYRMARQSFDKKMEVSTPFSRLTTGKMVGLYAAVAAVLVAAAAFLGVSADRLAGRYGLAATFAGATLLGVVTSLPEITNAVASSRRREYDLAVGNILGANALVLVVLAVASLLAGNRIFTSAPLEDSLSALVMAGLAVLMQSVALGALAVESGHHIRRLSVASMMLAALYAASLYLSYRFGNQ